MEKLLLENIGLSPREIDIYLALLRSGSVPVSRIAKDTGLHRTNIYDTLERLREKGLVSFIALKDVKYFKAADPSRILEYLEEKKESVQKIMPELTKLSSLPKDETNVDIFKGREGIKTVWNDIQKTGKDMIWIGAEAKFEEIMPEYAKRMIKSCDAKGLKERAILKREEAGNVTPFRKHDYRYLPKNYKVPTFFIVYGNKVAIFVWTLPYFVILIDNKDISDTYRDYFEFMWKFAKP